ncbi:MAG: formylglycine-generating enzyme family protein [Kiritimatiellae bacterium]|nr:formylglycine-generating enzyme family protein [Kiritimatiellia bacterium]
MKNLLAFAGIVAMAAATFGDDPQVGAPRLISTTASGVYTFGYTLTGAPGIVTFDVTTNGVSIGPQSCVAGTINELLQPGETEHVFTWRAGGNMTADVLAAAEFRLVAWPTNSPPDYLVIDIGAKTEPNRYYVSAGHLPNGGLANRIYATDFLVMRKIPAAGVTWYMGSDSTTDPQRSSNENRHRVTLTSDYWFSIYPVTKRQYYNMGGDSSLNGMRIKLDNEDHPISGFTQSSSSSLKNTLRGSPSDGINWPVTGTNVLATSVIGRFRTATGILFDLPTEAQWEYACRAGTGTAMYDGSTTVTSENADLMATYGVNSYSPDYLVNGNPANAATPVGIRMPNAWGIYDLYGQVWESCLDWYQATLTEETDPKGPSVENPVAGTHGRVRKGGCFLSGLTVLRSAYRDRNGSGSDFGVRIVCPIGLK